ncbi:MAG: helix-turn-helix transcriptional regulator [Desulfuromonadales bacterium]
MRVQSDFVFAAFAFAAFVWWLLAVPMDGPLLAADGVVDAIPFFLLPHTLSLAVIAWACPVRLFRRLAPAGIVLTVALTLAVATWPSEAPHLLPPLGVCGAFVAIQASCLLRQSPTPILSAALGLVAANLLLIPLHVWPGGGPGLAAIICLPLILLLLRRPALAAEEPPPVGLWRYLPFVLVFHVLSGLMYGFIAPAYNKVAFLPGAELPFYMATVLGGIWLYQKHRDLTLVCGIVLGMVAFILLKSPTPLAGNLSMFTIQAGQGFVDIFLLAYLLSFPQPLRSFGFGLATLCLGIAAGRWLESLQSGLTETIVLTGQVVINLSVIALYLLSRRPQPAPPIAAPAPPIAPPMPEAHSHIPDNIRLLLSEREYLVLARSLEGSSYRHTAAELGISESTVKTYMKRICDKLGAVGKKDLLRILAQQ